MTKQLLTRIPDEARMAQQDFSALCAAPFDFERAAQFSFADYHVKGLTYINLQFHSDLIVKLYSIPGNLPRNAEGYLLGPHDHAYDFRTFVLGGSIEHWTFDWGGDAPKDWNLFRYTAADRSFELLGPSNPRVASHSRIQPNNWYHLDANTIHTLAPGPRGALLLLYQKPDRRSATRFYSKSESPPDTTGLYNRMSPDAIKKFMWDS